jgi:ABC-type bacteriocin/lantibiotic exporter with double-glycine peptidase domain
MSTATTPTASQSANYRRMEKLPGRSDMAAFFGDFLRDHLSSCIWLGLLMLGTVCLQLAVPVATMYVFDHVIPAHDLTRLALVGWTMLALIGTRHWISYLNEALALRLREQVIFDIQARAIGHLHRLPLSFFSAWQSVYLQSRVMNDARSVEGALIKTFVSLTVDGLTFAGGLIFIFVIHYQLALLTCALLCPFAFIRYFTNDRMRVLSQEMQEGTARASALIAESFAGIRAVKSFGHEDFQTRVIGSSLSRLKDIYVKTNMFGVISALGASFIMASAGVLILWLGSSYVIKHTLTIGGLVSILSLLGLLFNPVSNFVAANLRIQQAIAAIRRIYEFLHVPVEETGGVALAMPVKGSIMLDQLRFAYVDGTDVLKGVNLEVKPGCTLALAGGSGAGKTTLVNLLLKFYQPTGGRIYIDGLEISETSSDSLREHIGVVDQNAFLFDGSIMENIRFGRLNASDEEVARAARLSYAWEFIESLPDGYHTRVGERGVRLSGGQCQRIALARMFLKNPSILILDEAVSSVDSESEAYIQDALVKLLHGRTTILIAHRLSSLRLADRIAVLKDGRIVEEGGHEELLLKDGAYKSLFSAQFHPATANDLEEKLSLTAA